MENQDEHRGRQFLVGAVILLLFFGSVTSLLIFWRLIPGWIGESVGTFAGVISTPFFMEFSVAVAGAIIILTLNIWRRRKIGGDFVEIEEKDLPEKFRSDHQ